MLLTTLSRTTLLQERRSSKSRERITSVCAYIAEQSPITHSTLSSCGGGAAEGEAGGGRGAGSASQGKSPLFVGAKTKAVVTPAKVTPVLKLVVPTPPHHLQRKCHRRESQQKLHKPKAAVASKDNVAVKPTVEAHRHVSPIHSHFPSPDKQEGSHVLLLWLACGLKAPPVRKALVTQPRTHAIAQHLIPEDVPLLEREDLGAQLPEGDNDIGVGLGTLAEVELAKGVGVLAAGHQQLRELGKGGLRGTKTMGCGPTKACREWD